MELTTFTNSQATDTGVPGIDQNEQQLDGQPLVEHQRAKPEKYTDAQQAHINELIRSAQSRAAKGLRAELNQAKSEMQSLQATLDAKITAGDPRVHAENAELKAELAALKRAGQEAQLDATLRAAATAAGFVDPEVGVMVLRPHVREIDGRVVGVDAEGNLLHDASMNPLSPHAVAERIAAQKPYMVRGNVHGGTGSTQRGNMPTSGPKLEDLFGKSSNSQLANNFALRQPNRYAQLRRQAREQGLI